MRPILLDTMVYALSRAVPAVVGLVTVIVLVRLVEAEGYAYFGVAFATANAASVIASGWLTQAILRFHALGTHRSALERSTLRLSIIASVCVAMLITVSILAAISASWMTPTLLILAALLAVSLTAHAIVSALLQSSFHSRSVAWIETVRSFLALGLAVGLYALMGLGYMSAILGFALAGFVSTIVGWRMFVGRTSSGSLGSDYSHSQHVHRRIGELLKFGAPMSGWMGVSMLFPVVDRWLIQHFLGLSAVGTYAAVYDVVFRGCGLVLLPVVLAAHPRVMRAHDDSKPANTRELIVEALRLQLALMIPIVLVAIAVGSIILSALLGIEKDSIVQLIAPLAVAGCLWQVSLLAHKYLEVKRKTAVMLAAIVMALIVATLLNVLALPRVGLVASSYAMIAGGALYAFIVGIVSLSQFRADTRKAYSSIP